MERMEYVCGVRRYCVAISDRRDGDARVLDHGYATVRQVHGDRVVVREASADVDMSVEADAIITTADIPIAVYTADCNGIVIMGKICYSVVHAGWRGVANRIVKKTIAQMIAMGENACDLVVMIGPSIRVCCYCVGDEVSECVDVRRIERRDGQTYYDMISDLVHQCREMGVRDEQFTIHQGCTQCDDRYYSHRRGDRERMIMGVGWM